MKMGSIEKRFVNRGAHARRVATAAERRLSGLPFRKGQSYLDVGCGNGAAALRVVERAGLEVTGIDVDPEQVELARAAAAGRPGVRFVVGSATRLPFAEASFDWVATNKTTHHIPSWEDAVAEMIRVLRPGGYLLYADLVVPRWLASAAARLLGRRIGLPTRAAVDGLAARQGLTAVRRLHGPFSYDAVFRRGGVDTESVAPG